MRFNYLLVSFQNGFPTIVRLNDRFITLTNSNQISIVISGNYTIEDKNQTFGSYITSEYDLYNDETKYCFY